MTSELLLTNIGIGGLLGITGQLLRAVAGLKKHSMTTTTPKEQTDCQQFSWTRFGVSMILGGVAGVLAVLMLWDDSDPFTKKAALGIIAAGYSGSDFLEGVIKWLPNTNNT
jgi:hypothetical protein